MASVALGVAGAAIGSIFGAPGVGYMIGSALGAALFPPAGPDGPRLTDLKVHNSTYGSMIPIVYGRHRIAGTVIWADDLVEHANEQDSGSGGGGATTYTYTCSFAVSVCEGLKNIAKIWADGKLIYDFENDIRNYKASSLVFYNGSEDQLPDPTIEAVEGAGNVPAYRGQCYFVFTDLELGKYGNRIPNLTMEVTPIPDIPEVFESIDPVSTDLGGVLYGPGTYGQYEDGTVYVSSTDRLWRFTNPAQSNNFRMAPGYFAILNPNGGEFFSVDGYTSGEKGAYTAAAPYISTTPPATQADFDDAACAGDPTWHTNEYLIIPVGATGAWSGKDKQLAKMVGGVWQFVVPTEGMGVLDYADSWDTYFYTSGSWVIDDYTDPATSIYNFTGADMWMEYCEATDTVAVCSTQYGIMNVYNGTTGECIAQKTWPDIVWSGSTSKPDVGSNIEQFSMDEEGYIWTVAGTKTAPKLRKINPTTLVTISDTTPIDATLTPWNLLARNGKVFYDNDITNTQFSAGKKTQLAVMDRSSMAHTMMYQVTFGTRVFSKELVYVDSTNTVHWSYEYPGGSTTLYHIFSAASPYGLVSSPSPAYLTGSWSYDPYNDYLWEASITTYLGGGVEMFSFIAYDPVTYSVIRQTEEFLSSNDGWNPIIPMPTQVVLPNKETASGFYRWQLGIGDSDGIKNLGQIVYNISMRTGALTSGQVNVNELTDEVTGYCIANVMPARSAIEPLATAYFFDAVESVGKIKFVKRGANPVVTIGSSEAIMVEKQ